MQKTLKNGYGIYKFQDGNQCDLECRGNNGFGFDEIFELPNGLTLAELSSDEKNSVSARSLAINDLKKKLEK